MSATKGRSKGKRQAPLGNTTEAVAQVAVIAPLDAPLQAAAAQLTLDGSLQIKDVEAMQQRLMATFDGAATVTVDISGIQSIDTAGIQLLLAYQGEAAKRQIAVDFSGDSPAVVQALLMLGLRDRLRAAASRG